MEFHDEYKVKPYDSFHVGDSMTRSVTFSEEDVRKFSELTGDSNSLHLDEEFAKTTFFGTRLVQGFFVNSACGAALSALCGMGAVNMGQNWTCPAPTYLGDTVTYVVTVVEKNDDRHEMVIDTKGTKQNGVVVFTGDIRIRIMDKKKSK